MSSTPRRALAIAAALAALVATTAAACDPPPPTPHEPGALALVVGGRSNMPKPRLVGGAEKFLDEAVLSQDKLFVVGVSGRPEVLYEEEIEHACDSGGACDAVVEEYREQTDALLGKVTAKTEEADTLAAIVLAARSVAGVPNSGPKRVVVIDNGMQTTGAMPLQAPGALSADPAETVKNIAAGDRLAHLKGVEILLTGIGSWYAPQEALTAGRAAQLETLWQEVLRGAGAKVTLDPTTLPDGGPAGTGLPPVTVVPARDEEIKPLGKGCFRIREDQVGFRPNRAEFRDPGRAREVLRPIAKELRAMDITATVVGTTAYPESRPGNPLSNARARAVVGILVELGVRESSLLPNGVGTKFAGYKDPRGADGQQSETLAVQNRLVIITPVGQLCPA